MSKPINGTGVPDSRKYPEIYKRIEILGKLNDRYNEAVSNQDRQELRKIAAAYEEMGCPRRAADIRDGIRKRRVITYASGSKQSTINTGATT